jgi:adenosine deaminase
MPETLFSLASRNNITLSSASDKAYESTTTLLARYSAFTSLDDFLHYYYIGMSVLLHRADFEDMGYAYLRKAHEDGVVHAEIFFDPQAHVVRGVPFDVVLGGLRDACEKAEREWGMSTMLICCFLRHLPASEAMEMWKGEALQAALKEGSVAGIGLDSSENGFPPGLFKEVWDLAAEAGVKCTMHAGEEGPASNIQTALFELGCLRADHGIRLVEDEKLMRRVVEAKKLLTVCPLSNVALRCVKSVEEVPIRRFLDEGVRFSVNSDDPAYFGGFILDNYCAVQEAHGLSKKEWFTICGNAIEGSWCGKGRKEEMMGLLRKVEKEFA